MRIRCSVIRAEGSDVSAGRLNRDGYVEEVERLMAGGGFGRVQR